MPSRSRIEEIQYTAKLLAFARPTGHIAIPTTISIIGVERGNLDQPFAILKGEELETLYKEFFASDMVELFDIVHAVYAFSSEEWGYMATSLEKHELAPTRAINKLRAIAQMVQGLEEE